MSQVAYIYLDSNDRFSDNFRNCPFWQLPHDKNGFVCLQGHIKEGQFWYCDQAVFALSDLAQYSKISRNKSSSFRDLKYYSTANDCQRQTCAIQRQLTVMVPIIKSNSEDAFEDKCSDDSEDECEDNSEDDSKDDSEHDSKDDSEHDCEDDSEDDTEEVSVDTYWVFLTDEAGMNAIHEGIPCWNMSLTFNGHTIVNSHMHLYVVL